MVYVDPKAQEIPASKPYERPPARRHEPPSESLLIDVEEERHSVLRKKPPPGLADPPNSAQYKGDRTELESQAHSRFSARQTREECMSVESQSYSSHSAPRNRSSAQNTGGERRSTSHSHSGHFAPKNRASTQSTGEDHLESRYHLGHSATKKADDHSTSARAMDGSSHGKGRALAQESMDEDDDTASSVVSSTYETDMMDIDSDFLDEMPHQVNEKDTKHISDKATYSEVAGRNRSSSTSQRTFFDSEMSKGSPGMLSSTSRNSGGAPWSTSRYAKMCIVCNEKPSYSKGGKSYPTCGLTCAAKLDDQQTRLSYRPGSSSGRYPCKVCNIRERAVSSSGRRFETCGFNCSSKLESKPGAGLCDVCRKHSKRVVGERTFDHCGRRCEEKAKAALASASAGTCDTCVACWKARVLPDRPFCGDECRIAMSKQAPTLIEIPRGHVLFDKYNKKFEHGWDKFSQGKVTAKYMYCISSPCAVIDQYLDYKRTFGTPSETHCWISIPRECNVGDSGSINLCSSPTCRLCDFIRNSFVQHAHRSGISASINSANAARQSPNARGERTKAMLFVEVVHARLEELAHQRLFTPPSGVDVVSVVSFQGNRKVATGDLHIYNMRAILPVGLLIYS